MASPGTANDPDESRLISETSPLLQHAVQPGTGSAAIPPRLKRRVVVLLCAFAFTMMLGDNLQPAALIQILESVICDEYNTTHQNTTPSIQPPSNDRCKSHEVQKELAFVRGFQKLVPLFAALLCTVPFGLLAERIGRKRVLIMSGTGVFASLSWVLALCYWKFLPARWVWLSGIFLFIGGGDAVTSSLVHVMVTDVTDSAERAQIFLYLHAADVISGFFGPAISGALMESGHTWTVLILADVTLFSGTFLLTYFIPETLNLRERSSQSSRSTSQHLAASATDALPPCIPWSNTSKKTANSIVAKVFSTLSPLGMLISNRQALLLLVIFAPQSTARDVFAMIGLQYSSAKYSLSYARGNLLLSVFQAAQGLFVLALLPLITRLITKQCRWTAWQRDRVYAIASIAVTAFGLAIIAIAPNLSIETLGLLLVALGSCTTGLLMSLLGDTVTPSQVSTVYSTALMLSIISRSISGPIVNGLLVKGLELGWNWMGLPFAVIATLMALILGLSHFIRKEA